VCVVVGGVCVCVLTALSIRDQPYIHACRSVLTCDLCARSGFDATTWTTAFACFADEFLQKDGPSVNYFLPLLFALLSFSHSVFTFFTFCTSYVSMHILSFLSPSTLATPMGRFRFDSDIKMPNQTSVMELTGHTKANHDSG
jgi:hypothetical protein